MEPDELGNFRVRRA